MDPFLAALALEMAAGASVDTGKALLRGLIKWGGSDEVEALFLELDERFGEIPGFSAVGLEPLRRDPTFLELLLVFWRTGQFPRDEMVAAIEAHVGATEELTAHEFAEEVADAIDLYSARARHEDRELFAIEVLRQSLEHELDTLREELRTARSVRHVTVEWSPPFARERLRRMLAEHASDLALLEDALAGVDDPRDNIKGLIADPPRWLVDSGQVVWDALGEIAGGYALWESGSAAFERASDLPGADRVLLLARAAANALLAGDEERYGQLLGRASALDPGHSQVVLTQLRPGMTPEERLELLGAAPHQTDLRREASLNVARAIARMDLGQWDEAEELLGLVREQVPEHQALRYLTPLLAIGRARLALAEARNVDAPALRQAAKDSLEFRTDLLAAYRFDEAGRLLARASTALSFAGEKGEAKAVLELRREEEITDDEARVELVEAALLAGDAKTARALASVDPTEHEELLLAQEVVVSSNASEHPQTIARLDRLVGSADRGVRFRAAVSRQVAGLGTEVAWSEAAQRLIEEEDPPLAAILRAEELRHLDRSDEADALLLRYSDDNRALRELIRAAGQRDEWDNVLELSKVLTARDPSALDRLVLVDATYRTGGRDEAIAELVALRRDESVPTQERQEAFRYSARIARESFDHEALEQISHEWAESLPEDELAKWQRLFALLRLGRGREAIDVALEAGLTASTLEHAELLAAVYGEDADAEVAARRIRELSDQFDRPERLEAHFLLTALRVQPEDRIADIAEEVQNRLSAFVEQYPDSEIIRSVPMDTSPEGIDAFFREYIEPGATHIREVAEQVLDGTSAVAVLAAVSGRPVTVATVQLERLLPLAFGDSTLRDLERQDAEAAIGRSVAWDAVALGVVGLLPPDIAEAIRLAFPGSVIAQATIDDVRRAGDTPAMDRDEYGILGYDAHSQQRFFRERTQDEVRKEREALVQAAAVARRLRVEPDVDGDKPTEFDSFLTSEEDRDLSFRTWPASLAIAQREHRPVYSDDRFIRLSARKGGLPSFGTLAVLDVLHHRKMISAELHQHARAELRRTGANGVGATLEELREEGHKSDWALSEGLAFALLDPTAWQGASALETYRIWAGALRTIFHEQPALFQKWVLRFMDAAYQHLPRKSFGFIAQSLLLIAWEPLNPQEREFTQALIDALRTARLAFGWFPDPVLAVAQQLQVIERNAADPQVQGLLARQFFADVSFADQLRLLGMRL